MSNQMELSHTHFRQMKKHLAAVEKAWSEGALVEVKNELHELDLMAGEIKRVIKNQLYHSLREPVKETSNVRTIEGRGAEKVS